MRGEERKKDAQPDGNRKMQKAGRYTSVIGLLLCIGFSVWGYQSGILKSSDSLHVFIGKFGSAGAVVFVLIQIIQVVFPVIPGGVSCLAGVLLFGPWFGFFYNYIGICIGSMAAFGIAKVWGSSLLDRLFSEKMIRKYEVWTAETKCFLRLFAAAIFFPVAPDDFLCYLAGTTSMSWKQFSVIIFLGKPASIALYSMGLTTLFRTFFPAW